MFKGTRILNISDPDRFTGHTLRSVYITKIVNNPNVNQKESQLATRHGSVSAQLPYIVPNENSEVEKLKDLGIEIPDEEKKIQVTSHEKERKVS